MEESDHLPTKVSILGRDDIVVDYGIFGSYVAKDLLNNVSSSTYVLVTDFNLYDVYVPSFQAAFQSVISSLNASARLLTYQIPPGETSKSVGVWETVQRWMLSKERNPPCDTRAVIVALGGGVIGDLIGFGAATFKRGIRFVQVPTSLLAMVDSSIGGKTAIDVKEGKNLIGAFWQPSRIYVDLQFLETLPIRECINGMAEVIKTAAIWDEQAFEKLEQSSAELMDAINTPPSSTGSRFAKVSFKLKEAIIGSIRVKAHVVTADEREGGLRNLLNFGHSIGHAIEGILAPDILHGECVAVGMQLEAVLARYLGVLDGSAVARLTKCLAAYGLPISLADKTLLQRSKHKACPVDQLLTIMAVDKKNEGSKKRIVLLGGIGRTHERKASVVADKDIRLILSTAVQVKPSVITVKDVVCIPPGSKSISNRALVLAALANGTCRLKNLLHSDDTEVMMSALTELKAATFSWENDGQVLAVKGNGGRLMASIEPLYLGNAGTASRFLTSVATLAQTSDCDHSIVTGNARMKQRPIGPLVAALKQNGAAIDYVKQVDGSTYVPKDFEELQRKDGHCLPLKIRALGGMEGGDISLDAGESSQYVSSILMSAPMAKTSVTLRMVGGPPISQPYIDMTTAMMASFGIAVRKSETEAHTYHIPKGEYISPPEYVVESDASSATYPLAIAALSGTTCTVPNIGSDSLQGDAQFAVKILRQMSCDVTQTKTSTKVSGPPLGSLQPIEEVDMTTMTDAFLTASVLAATAKGSGPRSTTRIVGIANQQKKECERISAMRDQLQKFGVTCRLWPFNDPTPDGLEVDGIDIGDLSKTIPSIHCYDDHRVAMSFSVLATAAPAGAIIEERECVGKTWPSWWDTLKQAFKVDLEGLDTETSKPTLRGSKERSIFLVGMRGAGKTTMGKWAAKALGWQFLDLDDYLESETGIDISRLKDDGDWAAFRRAETQILTTVMRNKANRHVFACGGGVVEQEANRRALKEYQASGGIVISVHRDITNIVTYLEKDRNRPAYIAEAPQSVWERRRPWYAECSNFTFYSTSESSTVDGLRTAITESVDSDQPALTFETFLKNVVGTSDPLKSLSEKDLTFFISLTLENIDSSLETLPHIFVGSDAVELRVDLLKDPLSKGAPSSDFVVRQVALLRQITSLPIIFTVRTLSQGGKYSDVDHEAIYLLLEQGLGCAVEFLDVEMSLPETTIQKIVAKKGFTKIIASYHDTKHDIEWGQPALRAIYDKASRYGDIIKLVGVAKSLYDNVRLNQFRSVVQSPRSKPAIMINMGELGQDSRVANGFLTPVSHPLLPFKAAPGQLSANEIRTKLSTSGIIQPRNFYIFGKPVAQSRSPALHNTLFRENGLPHQYDIIEADNARDLKSTLYSPSFGGASVTIPLKLDIMPHLDAIAEDAEVIGAVNTVVVDESRTSIKHLGRHLLGRNTDWLGMRLVLEHAGATAAGERSGLVIGGGGTARAAIYTLHQMGFSPIYIVGRSLEKLHAIAQSFSDEYNLYSFGPKTDREFLPSPAVAISTIPADQPIEPELEPLLHTILRKHRSEDDDNARLRVLLEMAYKPAETNMMRLAQTAGWHTIPGLEALAAQGLYQFEAWTGITPLHARAREIVLGERAMAVR